MSGGWLDYLYVAVPTSSRPHQQGLEPAHVFCAVEHPAHDRLALVCTHGVAAQDQLFEDHSVRVAGLQAACAAMTVSRTAPGGARRRQERLLGTSVWLLQPSRLLKQRLQLPHSAAQRAGQMHKRACWSSLQPHLWQPAAAVRMHGERTPAEAGCRKSGGRCRRARCGAPRAGSAPACACRCWPRLTTAGLALPTACMQRTRDSASTSAAQSCNRLK